MVFLAIATPGTISWTQAPSSVIKWTAYTDGLLVYPIFSHSDTILSTKFKLQKKNAKLSLNVLSKFMILFWPHS